VSAGRSPPPGARSWSTSWRLTEHPWAQWAEWEADRAAAAERRPGAVSRWKADKDLSWEPLRVELVCEVSYDHMEGSRFRHTAQFRHWRPDRTPESCTFEQLQTPVSFDLAEVLGTGR
jgi:ATP-dependent DNA ligase